eukprot:990787-Alexandrium_andersonii.AAC.1
MACTIEKRSDKLKVAVSFRGLEVAPPCHACRLPRFSRTVMVSGQPLEARSSKRVLRRWRSSSLETPSKNWPASMTTP